MSKYGFSEKLILETIDFHGHVCPGLAIGIRAAEAALNHFGRKDENPLFAVVETDMCGIDAIQFLTGCTYGKGNLIHLDYGKMAFSFYRRKDNASIRIVIKHDFLEKMQNYSSADKTSQEKFDLILDSDIESVFNIKQTERPIPRPAQSLKSVICDNCQESVMESRIRLYQDKALCIPCFRDVEQKI